MSLVEIMVVVAIMGIVALGAMHMFQNQIEQQNAIQFKSDSTAFVDEIRDNFTKSDTCKITFQNVNLGSPGARTEIDEIKNANAHLPPWDKTTIYSNGSLRIGTMEFIYDGDEEVPSVTGRGKARFIMGLESKRKVLGPRLRQIIINISTRKNLATGKLDSCSLKTSEDIIWRRTTGNPDHIYYNKGPVSIGSAAPQTELDVAGEIRFGNTGIACDGNRSGAIRYNATSTAHEYCNGSDWQAITQKETIIYMTCAWSGGVLGFGGMTGNCSVPSCPVDFAPVGPQTFEVKGYMAGRAVGRKVQACKGKGEVVYTYCVWNQSLGGHIGDCSPDPCPSTHPWGGKNKEAIALHLLVTVGNASNVCIRR